MTETEEATEPAFENAVDEVWVFGGSYADRDGKRHHRWFDANDREMTYAPLGSGRVVGGMYRVKVGRVGSRTTVWGLKNAPFTGDTVDEQRRMSLRADHEVAETMLRVATIERAEARDDALGRALEPLMDYARGLSRPQRNALVAIVVGRLTKTWLD